MTQTTLDLRSMRRKLHLTLRQASNKIGDIAYSTIWSAENGCHEIGSKKLERIVAFYTAELAKLESEGNV